MRCTKSGAKIAYKNIMNQTALTKAKPFRSAVSAEAVLDTLVTATMVLDTDLKVVFVNSAAESLLHCSATQIVGSALNQILLSAEDLQANLRKALREMQPFTARETFCSYRTTSARKSI